MSRRERRLEWSEGLSREAQPALLDLLICRQPRTRCRGRGGSPSPEYTTLNQGARRRGHARLARPSPQLLESTGLRGSESRLIVEGQLEGCTRVFTIGAESIDKRRHRR